MKHLLKYTWAVIAFVLLSTSVSKALTTNNYIYYIQVVQYQANSDGYWNLQFTQPDYSTFSSWEDCEMELLKAVSDPKSSVAKENFRGLNNFTVQRHEILERLVVLWTNDDNQFPLRIKGRCVEKNITSDVIDLIKEDNFFK